jgi:hypothetical protein
MRGFHLSLFFLMDCYSLSPRVNYRRSCLMACNEDSDLDDDDDQYSP